ncbi:hypothetical protein D3C71_2107720 [compost metagenome]
MVGDSAAFGELGQGATLLAQIVHDLFAGLDDPRRIRPGSEREIVVGGIEAGGVAFELDRA